SGQGNGGMLARLQSAVACGGVVDGVRLLSPKTIDRIFEVQSDGIDLVTGTPARMGLGYALLPGGRLVFGGGTGGSVVIADVGRRLTFAYVMNKVMPGAPVAQALLERLSDIVNR